MKTFSSSKRNKRVAAEGYGSDMNLNKCVCNNMGGQKCDKSLGTD